MTLEQLRIFVAVAEREHITRAAEALNLTQSATSAAVAALEKRYRTRLFSRVGRGIELTEAGRLFLKEARIVLARAAAAESVLADLAGLKRGTLRLAASQTVANYWLPPRMTRFHRAFPGVALPLAIGNTENVTRMIDEGSADLGFIEGDIEAPHLSAEKIADDRLVVVVHRDHPWARKGPATWRDLTATRWIVRERGSGTRQMFEAALVEHGLGPADLEVAMELPSNEAVLAATCAGGGAAVMSELAAVSALRSRMAVVVPFELPMRGFYLLYHPQRHLGPAAIAFREAIVSARPAQPPKAPDGPPGTMAPKGDLQG